MRAAGCAAVVMVRPNHGERASRGHHVPARWQLGSKIGGAPPLKCVRDGAVGDVCLTPGDDHQPALPKCRRPPGIAQWRPVAASSKRPLIMVGRRSTRSGVAPNADLVRVCLASHGCGKLTRRTGMDVVARVIERVLWVFRTRHFAGL